MGKSAWETSALITGTVGFFHFIWMVLNWVNYGDNLYMVTLNGNIAIVFTLSLIATLFFECKASEAPAEKEEEEEEEEEERKESEAKNKEVKKVKDDIF